MKITDVKKQGRHPDRLDVHVDDGRIFTFAAEVAAREGLHVGLKIDPERFETLARMDAATRARDFALRLLAHRPRAIRELRDRLGRKGIPSDVVDECIADLSRTGLLDDAEFSRLFARDRFRGRPRAPSLVVAELKARGVDEGTARTAVETVMADEESDEAEIARRALRKFRPRTGEPPARAKRRAAAFLARRGFGSEAIRSALERGTG